MLSKLLWVLGILSTAAFATSAPTCPREMAAEAWATGKVGKSAYLLIRGFFERRAQGEDVAGILADFLEDNFDAIPGCRAAAHRLRFPGVRDRRRDETALRFWQAANVLPREVSGHSADVRDLSFDGFPIVEVPLEYLVTADRENFQFTDIRVAVRPRVLRLADDATGPEESAALAARWSAVQSLSFRVGREDANLGTLGQAIRGIGEGRLRPKELRVTRELFEAASPLVGEWTKALVVNAQFGPPPIVPTGGRIRFLPGNSTPSDHLASALQRAIHLEELTVRHMFPSWNPTVASLPRSLRAVAFEGDLAGEKTAIRQMAENLPDLERVELDTSNAFAAPFMRGLRSSHLRTLIVRRCNLADEQFETLSSLASLVHLEVGEVSVRAKAGRFFSSLPKRLQRLSIDKLIDSESRPSAVSALLGDALASLVDLEAFRWVAGPELGPIDGGAFLERAPSGLRELELVDFRPDTSFDTALPGRLGRFEHLHRLFIAGRPFDGTFLAEASPHLRELVISLAPTLVAAQERSAQAFRKNLSDALERFQLLEELELFVLRNRIGADVLGAVPNSVEKFRWESGETVGLDQRSTEALVAMLRRGRFTSLALTPSALSGDILAAMPRDLVILGSAPRWAAPLGASVPWPHPYVTWAENQPELRLLLVESDDLDPFQRLGFPARTVVAGRGY